MVQATKKTAKKSVAFDYTTIKSFEYACKHLGLNPTDLPDVSTIPEEFRKAIIAGFKLMIIYKAINNGWKPDWSNYRQGKYYPWFEVLSSGFGFSHAHYFFDGTYAIVGSRLCTDTSEKALYIGKQFEVEYKDYFLFSE
jgi:hypothetical protein